MVVQNTRRIRRYWVQHTKSMHYYGVKLSFIVTESVFPLDYVASLAHDSRLMMILAEETLISQMIGDKGYLSKKLCTDSQLSVE